MERMGFAPYNIGMRYFADCHFHAMTMNHPNFAAFFASFYDSATGLLAANATQNYILTPQMLKGNNLLNTLENTLTAFERPIGETFAMMEDDLAGLFSSQDKEEYGPLVPYIHMGKLSIRGMDYDRMLMIPLVMDFSQDQNENNRLYYSLPALDKITQYADDTIQGMREYYSRHEDGLFEFYPFLGIDPKLHSQRFMEDLLEKYINTSHLFHKPHEIPRKPFYGIKIYPPLGFRPWPNDKEALEKHRYLYSFCEKNRVPIITHCDDQGFRGVSAEEAWKLTDPAGWRTVLENYPGLVIDFAHYGKQYAYALRNNLQSLSMRMKKMPDSPWFHTIISLMKDFRGVYADVSFSGCSEEFYKELGNYLKEQDEDTRALIRSRTLFGSDFSVNLLKIESYTQYYSIFENSVLSDDEIDRFASVNPIGFLGLKEEPERKRRALR